MIRIYINVKQITRIRTPVSAGKKWQIATSFTTKHRHTHARTPVRKKKEKPTHQFQWQRQTNISKNGWMASAKMKCVYFTQKISGAHMHRIGYRQKHL